MGAIFTDNATLGVVNSTVGAPVFVEADNTDNTNADSHGQLIARSGGSSGGAAMTVYDNRFQTFCTGIQAGTTTFKIVPSDSLGNDSAIKINNSSEVTFNEAYTFPDSDGSSNQVLATNGSGQLSFQDVGSISAYYSLTPYIVGQSGDPNAQYTGDTGPEDAIADAVTDGAGPGNYKNIYIKPGTYNPTAGNLNIPSGINLVGLDGFGTVSSNVIPSAIINGSVTLVDNVNSNVRAKCVNLGFTVSGDPSFKSGNPNETVELSLINCYIQGDTCCFFNDQEDTFTYNVELSSCYITSTGSLIENKSSTANITNFTCKYCNIVSEGALSDLADGTINVNAAFSELTAFFGSNGSPTGFIGSFYNSTHAASSNNILEFSSDGFSCSANYTNCLLINDIIMSGDGCSLELDNSFMLTGQITAYPSSYTRRNCLCTTVDSPGTLLAFKNFDAGNGNEYFQNGNGIRTTTDGETVISYVTVNQGNSIVMKGVVVGGSTNGDGSCSGDFLISARRQAGGPDVTLVGTPIVNMNTTDVDVYFTVAVDTGTQQVQILINGPAADTWDWACTYQFQKIAGGYV